MTNLSIRPTPWFLAPNYLDSTHSAARASASRWGCHVDSLANSLGSYVIVRRFASGKTARGGRSTARDKPAGLEDSAARLGNLQDGIGGRNAMRTLDASRENE